MPLGATDEFVSHFYELRRSNSQLRPADFLEDFNSIANVARDLWGVVLEEVTEDALLEGIDRDEIDRLRSVVQVATTAGRGWPKSEHVLRHDVAHLLLVGKKRMEEAQKIWFLTRDGSLLSAAEDLARNLGPDSRPLCFQMLGFLQSISPFVSSASEEDVLANFFSGLLTEQIFVPEKLFDDRELALISEAHADVMAMPADQVVVAVDYVKRHVLKGERYNADKVPMVALELRKYLSANTEERQRALQVLADQNHERYEIARQTMLRERALRQDYERRLEQSEEDLETIKATSASQQVSMEEIKQTQAQIITRLQKREKARDLRDRRILLSVVSVGGAASLGFFNQRIVS